MAVVSPFINIFRTKTEAFYFKNSQINTQFIFKGVQLLPNNTAKYIQVTETPNGLNLEDWQVNVVDLSTEQKTDITSYFNVESLTNDVVGYPQLYWSLLNVPFDFGYRLIYLEITQIAGETFYTNPFLITDVNQEKTTQFHYRKDKESVFQSISLQAWFNEDDKKTDLTTYYEVATGSTVSQAVKTTRISNFRTELMPKSVLINLTYVLESPLLFLDNQRYYLSEAVDLPKKTSQENFNEIEFNLTPNYGSTFFGYPDYSGVDYGENYEITI